MSMAMILSMPAAFATPAAPTTPPAGPDRSVLTGKRRVVSVFISPPLDWMMRRPESQPNSPSSSSSRFASWWILGMT